MVLLCRFERPALGLRALLPPVAVLEALLLRELGVLGAIEPSGTAVEVLRGVAGTKSPPPDVRPVRLL